MVVSAFLHRIRMVHPYIASFPSLTVQSDCWESVSCLVGGSQWNQGNRDRQPPIQSCMAAYSIVMYGCIFHIRLHDIGRNMYYGVVSVGRIDKITGLFCKRALWKRLYSGKTTYDLIDPTICSQPISYTCNLIKSDDEKTGYPTWGDIFAILFQSSKLDRLFCHVPVERDVEALRFELWKSFSKMSPQMEEVVLSDRSSE